MNTISQSSRIAALLPEQRALLMKRLGELRLGGRPRIAPAPRPPEGNRLCHAQQRFWLLDRLHQGASPYNVPLGVRVRQELQSEPMAQALNALVERHETLRTAIVSRGRDLRQEVRAARPVPLRIADVRDLGPEAQLDAVRRIEAEEISRPFDLAEPPALRAIAITTGEQDVRLHLVTHHALSDAQSLALLLQDFFTAYDAILRGADVATILPPLSLQYVDFAEWDRRQRVIAPNDARLRYWQERLSGSPAVISVPADRARPARPSYAGGRVVCRLSDELARAVDQLGRTYGATSFMTLLAAFQALVHRLTGDVDILVGCPISERDAPELESMVGCFINTVVVRVDLSGDPTFVELLGRVRTATLGAQAHRDVPFDDVVRAVRPERGSSHTPLFQIGFGLVDAPLPTSARGSLSFELLPTHNGCSKFDLTMEVVRSGATFDVLLEYASDLFDESTAERLLVLFRTLLQSLVADPQSRISQAPLLEGAERRFVLAMGMGDSAPTPPLPCAHALFEKWAAEHPEAPAVVYGRTTHSYAAVDAAANRMAHYLRSQGVAREDLVGICLRDPNETVSAVLATLKAGAAFVPLDPSYPRDRLHYMLDDCRPRVVICDSDTERLVAGRGVPLVNLAESAAAVAEQSNSVLQVLTAKTDRAYVIYTSGSTGRPKGVVIEHAGLLNLAFVQQQLFRVGPGDRVLQFSSFSFDASVWELSMAFFAGAALHPVDRVALTRNPSLLASLLRTESISVATLPPSMLAVLCPDDLPALRVLISAGERCSAELVTRWATGREFYNAYGPTETTVCATIKRCSAHDSGSPSIGRPLANLCVRILDAHGQPVPIGVPGNIHVGGVAVARGYLNRPDLSLERFIPDPFGLPTDRLYRTGDLGAFRADGDITFLGRTDDQVKIRGHRIEPGEIEAALAKIDGIGEAVVEPWLQRAGTLRLAAFVVPEHGHELSSQEILRQLREQLPSYMLPSTIIYLARLPQTPNGKIDRRALPSPKQDHSDVSARASDAHGLEQQIATVWKRVLTLDAVGTGDNFFDVGGDSLLLIEVQRELEEALGREVSPVTLFEHPTIATLVAALSSPEPKRVGVERDDQMNRAERRRASLNGMARRNSGGVSNER